MGKSRRLAAVLTAMLTAMLAATPANARWLRADTDNFIIYSESNEQSLRGFAEKLQRFDATLRLRFNLENHAEPNRLTVYLLSYSDEVGRLHSGRGGSNVAGFYASTGEGSFAVSHRERTEVGGTSLGQQTLFHEYSHYFMKRYVPAAFPAWFIEGFAEYYSTVDFTIDGKAEIGGAVQNRAYGLLSLPKVPAERLLYLRPAEMANASQMDVYYGRAWLLTHMLYNMAERQGQLTTYIQSINRGDDAKAAAAAAFGDLSALDRDLNKYMTGKFNFMRSKAPVPVSGSIRITPLSTAEDAVLPLRLRRLVAGRSERLIPVRDELRRLSRIHGDDAGLWYELAAAEWRVDEKQRDLAAVRAAVERAIAIDPNHVRANVLLGQLLLNDMSERDAATPADWTKARRPIVHANRTAPHDPMPLHVYFRSFLAQGVNPPAIAIDGLREAFVLAPENLEIRIDHAFALAHQGQFDAAMRLAQSVAFDPHSRDGEALLQRLEAMRENQADSDENNE